MSEYTIVMHSRFYKDILTGLTNLVLKKEKYVKETCELWMIGSAGAISVNLIDPVISALLWFVLVSIYIDHLPDSLL